MLRSIISPNIINRNLFFLIVLFSIVAISGCSSSKETTETTTDIQQINYTPPPINTRVPAQEVTIQSPPSPAQQPTIQNLTPDGPPEVISKRRFYGKTVTERGDTVEATFVLDDQNKKSFFNIKAKYAPVVAIQTDTHIESQKEVKTKPWYQPLVEFKWTILIILGIVIVLAVVFFAIRKSPKI